MKKFLFLLLALNFILFLKLLSQNNFQSEANQILEKRGEVYFSFQLDLELIQPANIEELSKIISIDNIRGNKVWAYANKKEFKRFSAMGIDFELLTTPSMLFTPKMLDSKEALNREQWDFYPTYFAYVNLMNQFAVNHPDLCEVVSIKTLTSTREILFIHINDSLGFDQNEPEFLYTSSIHGDEVTGYILMLHLIDYLLENYEMNEQVTNLVNNIDIWINPLANPDGTYAAGNNNIYGATRGNANGVDMNRNYADPEDGPHPDGNEWQPETQAFMDFAAAHDFVLSANFHGGAEVCNYPWDTWSRLAADDIWWIYVCRQYADTAHKYSPDGYMTDLDNGITNGYAWYSIAGGRQDYMNYFHQCREFTAEISSIKMIPENQLEAFWEYNYRSLLHYMEQSLFGVRGLVTNAATGLPVMAKISIEGHDLDKSEVYASLPVGDYHRLLKAGTYDLTFSSFGYYTQTIQDVVVTDQNTVFLNIQLQPYVSLTADFSANETWVGTTETVDFTDKSLGDNIVSWNWVFEGGEPATSQDKNPQSIFYNIPGNYDVSLTVTNGSGENNTLLKENYIRVADVHNIDNETVYTCSSLFFDSGGKLDPYSENENTTMTFISYLESGYLKVIFDQFELENSDNCENDYLEIFDGIDVNAPLLGKFCGNTVPSSFETTNIDGAVTFHFISNQTINKSGWKALITCDTNVGVPKQVNFPFKVYPNPADKLVRIQAQFDINSIYLKEISGKVIALFKPEKTEFNFDVSNLKSGIYLLEVIVGEKIGYQKIVIK